MRSLESVLKLAIVLVQICLLPVLSYTSLSDDSLRALPSPGNDFDIKSGALLAPILRPRVPGTEGSTAVQMHFLNFFRKSLPQWKIDFQNSTATTPVSNGKEVPFINIIATRDAPWSSPGEVGRLALVAHYDSKLTPDGFIGATDSAAPCAMLLHAARSIDAALTQKWDAMMADGSADPGSANGVQLILLDGEEAFKVWTEEDSVYGARSLAETWENTSNGPMSTNKTPLRSIRLFVLLDLLGSKGPSVPSYFKLTHPEYQRMAEVETRLRVLNLFKSSSNHRFLIDKDKSNQVFFPNGGIGDDHVPFMDRGVPVLHVIPHPFPSVWHTILDDGEHLDGPTVEDWAKLVTAFTAEYMDLEGMLHRRGPVERDPGPHNELNVPRAAR